MEQVILVDEHDRETGVMEKMEAHRTGKLHRAFSILLFNSRGEMLLQKRAGSKYHSGGLWTNACCSHPLPHESLESATLRKLNQELGITPALRFGFKFIYHIHFETGLIEHELDHVYFGQFDGKPTVNLDEVEDWKFMDMVSLRRSMQTHPEHYTYWFRMILERPELSHRFV